MTEVPNTPQYHPDVKKHPVWLRFLMVIVILVIGLAMMKGLSMFKTDPPPAEEEDIILHANAIETQRQDVETFLRGYGTARPHRLGEVTSEISGRVVHVHENLNTGMVVEKGDILVEIDPRDFELAVESAEAELARLETELESLDQEERNEQRRLELMREILDIARRELERTQDLVDTEGVESLSDLDNRRLELTSRENSVTEIENSLNLVDSRRAHITAQIRAAQSRLDQEKLNLERATIRAPFSGRIDEKMVEIGRNVSPGQSLLVLADDSILEISASIDGRDVANWMNLKVNPVNTHWFDAMGELPVEVRWTEGDEETWYTGRLERIEKYDANTRTFHLVTSVPARQGILDGPDYFPLTSGMFCEVSIPGKVARDVVPIPRSTIDSSSQVLLDVDGRIKTQPVTVARYQADLALVSEGLKTGDRVILNRPPNVLDGMRVDTDVVGEAGVELDAEMVEAQ